MSVSFWNLLLNSADSIILVLLIWLIVTHRTDIKMHTHGAAMTTAESDDIDWIRRQGRFMNCEPDSAERPQIKPGELISPNYQTHTTSAAGEYRDGS